MALDYNPDSTPGFPENTGGVRFKVESDTPVDNIFVVQDGDDRFRIQPYISGMYHASWVLSSSGDKTSYLQAMFNHASINTVVIDKYFNLSGTLTIPAGKVLKFNRGGILDGGGTITGGIIEAYPYQHIFYSTINLVSVITTDWVFWCEWYGAIGNNSTDNQPFIQKAVTYVCNNDVGLKSLRIGPGYFRIYKGINFWRDTNGDGNPEFLNVSFNGNTRAYEGNGNETVIICMHSDNFGINLQRGKGATMNNFYLRGVNQLNYSPTVAWDSNTTYLLGGVRSDIQSPYSGLVLDAIGAGTVGANRYPGFEDLYAGVVGNGGSTDCNFSGFVVDGFCCGVILSPNANTQNNEAHTFDGFWFSNVKDGFVTTNSQERTVRCTNFKFWNSTQVCLRTNGYGANRGEVPLIDTWNIAGNVYQLFNLGGVGGYFPVIAINKIYCESFYWIGYVGGVTVKFKDCHFAFVDIKLVAPSLRTQNFLVVGSAMHFDNCILITYNGAERVPYNIFGRTKFIDCFISNPVAYPGQDWTYDMYQVEYEDCRFYCDPGFISNGSFESKGSAYYSMTYGSQVEIATFNKEYTTYKSGSYNVDSANYFAQYRRVKSPTIRRTPIGNAVDVTVTGTTATLGAGLTFTPPDGVIIYARNLELYNGQSNYSGYAVMRHVSGGNCDRVIAGMFTQGYDLYYISINYIGTVGFCDVAGNSITNVVMEHQITAYDMGLGHRLISNFLQIVTASAAGTATLYYNNNMGTTTEAIISNYEYEEYGSSYCSPVENIFVEDGLAFTRGSFYKNLRGVGVSIPVGAVLAIGWLCVRSGVKGSPYPPVFLQQDADGSYS